MLQRGNTNGSSPRISRRTRDNSTLTLTHTLNHDLKLAHYKTKMAPKFLILKTCAISLTTSFPRRCSLTKTQRMFQFCNRCVKGCASSFAITEEMFKKRLSKVKKNGAPGPDNVTKLVLSELEDVVALPLTIIFNKSLSSGEVPEEWKIANVTPVFKKGSRTLSENYRPISLTSVVCKFLEVKLLSLTSLNTACFTTWLCKPSIVSNQPPGILRGNYHIASPGPQHRCVLFRLFEGVRSCPTSVTSC